MWRMDSQVPGQVLPTGPRTIFEGETAVTWEHDGVFSATLHRSWWIIAGPNGGYVAALILRAMVATVDDPKRRPRSLTVQYLRPPVEGGVTIEVTVERSGRTVTNLTARMIQDDKLIALALAAFATDREGTVTFDETEGLTEFFGGQPVPAPTEVEFVQVDPDRDVPMRRHYDLRWVLGDLPFSGGDGKETRARCGGWLRPAEKVPIDEVVLAAMSDAWMPPIFSRLTLPLAVPTIDLTIHFRDVPEDPFGFCFVVFESPVAANGYTVEHGRLLSPSGVLLAESRQLAVLT